MNALQSSHLDNIKNMIYYSEGEDMMKKEYAHSSSCQNTQKKSVDFKNMNFYCINWSLRNL